MSLGFHVKTSNIQHPPSNMLQSAILPLAVAVLATGSVSGSALPILLGQVNTTIFPNATYPGAINKASLAGATFLESSPPHYPSPWADGTGDWAHAYAKAKDFVSTLTLLEKVNLTTGVGWEGEQCVGQTGSIPRLGFRSLCMQDSPTGVRDTDFNSVFSSGQSAAATWDRHLIYMRGRAMGQEHKAKGVTVQLGPVVGPLGRAPEGGRNWEGFSPDPVLSGIAVAASVQGIQDAGVVACVKHFIGNEQEHFRQAPESRGFGANISDSYSSNIDDVTMHELYLWPFADAVRAGVGSVMCSYNQVNNSYACQNSKVLNGLLKGELGFQGFVMSDWSAQHSGVSSATAGLDMTMPGDTVFNSGLSYWGANLTLGVLNGTIPQYRLDDMCIRIMSAFFKVNMTRDQPKINFDSWTSKTNASLHFAVNEGMQQVNFHVDVRGNHASIIREIGARSTVLLKNTGALPLRKPSFLAVVGNDAGANDRGPNGCDDRGCDSGTLGMAWGSGSANFPYLVTPAAALQRQALADGTVFQAITDDYAVDPINALVSQAGVTAIVFVNADSGEGYINVDGNVGDRNNLTLWGNGDSLIKSVAHHCRNTIVVIHSTGPVMVNEWHNNTNVTAILWAGVPGQESGNSITDILYGKVNPSAKTPFTWGPTRESYGTDLLYEPNNPGQNGGPPQVNFAEGIFIDYRAFDKQNITPIYEFGFGLSYTTFEYSNLTVSGGLPGNYSINSGMTAAAPTFGSGMATIQDFQFPSKFRAIREYIYPYLNSTDPKTASRDPSYGQPASAFLPPKALDSTPQRVLPASSAPGGHPELWDVAYTVSVTVKNTGNVTGQEVVQMYVGLGGPNDAKVVLRNFEKVSIDPGCEVRVQMNLMRRDLSNWDVKSQNWVVTGWRKEVFVGGSSRRLVLREVLK